MIKIVVPVIRIITSLIMQVVALSFRIAARLATDTSDLPESAVHVDLDTSDV